MKAVLEAQRNPSTDVGPVISREAPAQFQSYIDNLSPHMSVEKQVKLPASLPSGFFMPPTLIRTKSLEGFGREIFGPILHVITDKEGSKAGGPHYVARIAAEITRSNNITARVGESALLNLVA